MTSELPTDAPPPAAAPAGDSLPLRRYMWAVTLGALPVSTIVASQAVHGWRHLGGRHPAVVAAFAAVLIVGELFPIPVVRGAESCDEITVSSTFGFGLLLLAPAAVAIASQLLALVIDGEVRHRRRSRIPFNAAQYALAFCAAREVYAQLTGTPFAFSGDAPPHAGAALVAAGAFLLVNNLLVGVAIARSVGMRLHRVFAADLAWQISTSAPLLGLGIVVVGVVLWSPLAACLLLVPIIAMHRSGRMAMRLEREALRDTLTGLGNRTLLASVAERAIGNDTTEVAMLLVDLDHFKDVNDTLGHAVGDEVLLAVAERLQAIAGANDLVCRLGGDEFVVLQRGGAAVAVLQEMADRICLAVRRPVVVQGVTLNVGCSVGIAVAPTHASTVAELLRCADIAMYSAKSTRGTSAVYDPRSDRRSAALLGLPADLRAALDDPADETVWVAYQPQVDLATGQVGSVECLARWSHHRFGAIPPATFVPIAENTTLIDLLLERVLERALAQLSSWDLAGTRLRASVNLSARHLSDHGLPGRIATALARHHLDPSRLVLEVTESRLMANPEQSIEVLRRLHESGVRLSIDDFGTGYSSLSYLQRLSVDELKIDQSFVAELARSGEVTIVRSTIDLGHNLGLVVVAEGVEDAATAGHLAAMGCDLVQGFWYGHPVAAAELPGLLADLPRPQPQPEGRLRPHTGAATGARRVAV